MRSVRLWRAETAANSQPESSHAMNPIIIESNRTLKGVFADLWDYRELFLFLAWRDLLVRYKQTYIGIAWAVLQPLLIVVVFTVIFGKVAKMPSGGAPYPVLILAAVLPWQFFANALSESSNSLVQEKETVIF